MRTLGEFLKEKSYVMTDKVHKDFPHIGLGTRLPESPLHRDLGYRSEMKYTFDELKEQQVIVPYKTR